MPGIVVNGETRSLDKTMTVLKYLEELGVDPKRVVIELNRDILPRTRLDQVLLKDEDVLEIVHFVGGG